MSSARGRRRSARIMKKQVASCLMNCIGCEGMDGWIIGYFFLAFLFVVVIKSLSPPKIPTGSFRSR